MRQNMFPTQQHLLQHANLARMQAQRQTAQPVSKQTMTMKHVTNNLFIAGAKNRYWLSTEIVVVNCSRGKEPAERT